eukprot:6165867-Pyramimonas_sp.AAC.1
MPPLLCLVDVDAGTPGYPSRSAWGDPQTTDASTRAGQTSSLRARVYSHYGPIRPRERGHVLTTDQSDAGYISSSCVRAASADDDTVTDRMS